MIKNVNAKLSEDALSLNTLKNQLWHSMESDECLKILETGKTGLNEQEVKQRQKQMGKNILPVKKLPSIIQIFFHQFSSPLIYILILAGAVSAIIGELTDAFFIFIVIVLNALMGSFQEWKAEKSAEALQDFLKIYTRVLRDNTEQSINADELVPGDLVLLESGVRVPADLRLITSKNLSIDEALLTGESQSIPKAESTSENNTKVLALPITEQKNMAFASSTIITGRGLGLVVETGLRTEIGKIASVLSTSNLSKTPLVLRMEKFTKDISLIILGSCFVLTAIGLAQGLPFYDLFFIAVALAVAAIPEGLPIAITVALSIGVERMAKRNVIIRKMTAVEGLGSCTYIASDKTGTMTLNRQTLKQIKLPYVGHFKDENFEVFEVSGEGYSTEGEVLNKENNALSSKEKIRLQNLAILGTMCNEAYLSPTHNTEENKSKSLIFYDPLDISLLALSYKLGLDPNQVRKERKTLFEIPYESEKCFSAKVYQEANGQIKIAVKGAVETLLAYSTNTLRDDGLEAINKAQIEDEAVELSRNGYRVICIAEAFFVNELALKQWDQETLPELNFVGLIGLIDPLRPEVKEAVESCHQAGVQVSMVTGDHPATALSISKTLGIAKSEKDVMTGTQIAELGLPDSEEFINRIKNIQVFARVTPLQKRDIVYALRKAGHFIAVTGDGVNDTPALKEANISVAMGSGTDLTKETASIILADDNFSSLVAGIEEGRMSYNNIRKMIYFLVACAASEVFIVLLSVLTTLPIPLLAVQLLWLNLVTDGIQVIALAFESGEKNTMSQAARQPSEGIFNDLMKRQIIISSLFMGLTAFVVWFGLLATGRNEAEARNIVLLLMIFMQNIHVFNCRSERLSAFKVPLGNNKVLLLGILGTQALHLLAMNLPFMQNVLGISPVTLSEWGLSLTLASSILIVMELFKALSLKKGINPIKS